MGMIKTVVMVGLTCCLILGPAGCASPKYVHAVFFTCKPGTPDSEIDALVTDWCEQLKKVPSVRRVESGRRDTTAVREVNDQEYDVGLIVHFEDKAGYDAYDAHSIHRECVAKHKDHWSKVRVYDFVAK